MIVLLSPAKSLNHQETSLQLASEIRFKQETDKIFKMLQRQSLSDLKTWMKLSDKLALEVHQMHQDYSLDHFNLENGKQTILLFNGTVFKEMKTSEWTNNQFQFTQNHLRILSGAYGILRPLDIILPYRLEMGKKLKWKSHPTLYKYWKDKVTHLFIEDIKENSSKFVLNLASKEYSKVIDRKQIPVPFIDVFFKEYKDGKLKSFGYNEKKARGILSKFIFTNQITSLQKIKGFSEENYIFDDKLSDENSFYFIR